jgi:acetyltransferase
MTAPSPKPERLTSTQAVRLRAELISLLQDAVSHGASIGYLRPLGTEAARDYWDEIIRDLDNECRVLIAVRDEGKLVGTVQLGLCRRPNGAHRAEVQKLLVHSAARRRGLGRALMAAAEAEARAERRTLIYLDTEPDQPAEALYRKLGWQEAGRIPDYATTPDGKLHPTVFYYKRLA